MVGRIATEAAIMPNGRNGRIAQESQGKLDVIRDVSEPNLIDRPPRRTRRRWINGIIVAVLLYQIIVPLRFYSGLSGIDERFSWRFFSSVSMMQHEYKVNERFNAEKPQAASTLPLDEVLQVAVVKKLLNTHHDDIVRAFLEWRVQQPGVEEVRYDRKTTTTDGYDLPPVHYEKHSSRSP